MKTFAVERRDLGALLETLRRRGYALRGPVVRDSTIAIGDIARIEDLPIGWTEEQSNARYRLKRRDDASLFGYTLGPQSWKRDLFPPAQQIVLRERKGKGFIPPARTGNGAAAGKRALIGVRSCDLHALAIHDQIFLQGPHRDPLYETARADIFIVAVNCSQPGGTCFCASLNTGPRAVRGYDLALTEILTNKRHFFVAEVGSDRGSAILKAVPHEEASADEIKQAREICDQAARQMGRDLDVTGLKDLLYQNVEHPRWERTAARCLSCANCTMVCPTCFCTTIEDRTDLAGKQAERIRKWDSCFTLDFSYIHGGSVRSSVKARYRQWMTHKLASWVDQFGVFGCVGCGRCITWCPVGIDITEEARAIREGQPAE